MACDANKEKTDIVQHMTYHPGFQDSKGLSGIFFWGVLVLENSCTKSQDITHYILSISIQILHTVLYTFLIEFTGITFFLKKELLE